MPRAANHLSRMEKFQNSDKPSPLIVHVIHHLGVGGLENGLVNLINHIPQERYRHAIVCLKGYSDVHKRITRNDVKIVALDKREGKDFGLYLRLFKTLRQLKPDIVHTRNLATMESQMVAALAQVPARVHGEHGRDIFDLHGKNRKYNLLRKAVSPFIDQFITVSKDLEGWLIDTVGATPARVRQIYNGVDSTRFHPRNATSIDIDASINPSIATDSAPNGFFTDNVIIIGSVGRMAAVKDFPNLVQAFLMLLHKEPAHREKLRLMIVGDGVSRQTCIDMLRDAGAENLAWLPGERADIAALMRSMDLFVLPSLGEGISNTILEAMASGLPVVATDVGGNNELVKDGITGKLVPPAQPEMLADILQSYCNAPELRNSHGAAARQCIDSGFSMDAMSQGYLEIYDRVLRR